MSVRALVATVLALALTRRCGICFVRIRRTDRADGDAHYCARCELARLEARAIYATLDRRVS